jgi:signal transduction histidine kinase
VKTGDRDSVRGGVRARTYLASGVLALLVGGSFVVLLLSIGELRRSAELERHSQEVLVAANRVERLVVDLETGLRGFLITDDPRFLEPWNEARGAIPSQTSALERLAQVPAQHARAERLTQVVSAYIDDYSVPLLDAARRDLPSAGSTATLAEGKRRLDAIRVGFDRFEAAERSLSATRHAGAEAAARRSILAAAGGIAGSILLVVIFSGYLGRIIVRPVRLVATTAGRIAGGDLSARAPEVGVAEIGLLGRSFNEMAASVESSQAKLARFAEEQSALRRVATLVARGVPPPDAFGAVTEEVGRLLRADIAHMVRFETDGTASGVAGWSRGDDPIPVGRHVSLDGESVTASVLKTGRASRMDSYADTSGPIADALRAMGVHSSVGCPVIVDGRRWGVVIASSKGEALPADAESRLTAFTELAATAISNAHASAELAASRARIVAAADDARRRIERDLHDGTQQRIVSLGLELRSAELAVPPELPELQKQVADVANGLESLLEELREISRGIHPAILSEGGLGPALRALGRRSPIPVELDARTDARFPEHVEVTAYYVASEALANAAKHAEASVAVIVLEQHGDVLRLTIRDDGVGGADPAGGSGLIGLVDRVQAMGGTVVISSPVGEGTSMIVEVPTRGGSAVRDG